MLCCARAVLELKLLLHLEQVKAVPFPVEAGVVDIVVVVVGNETDCYSNELRLGDGRRFFVVACPEYSVGRNSEPLRGLVSVRAWFSGSKTPHTRRSKRPAWSVGQAAISINTALLATNQRTQCNAMYCSAVHPTRQLICAKR